MQALPILSLAPIDCDVEIECQWYKVSIKCFVLKVSNEIFNVRALPKDIFKEVEKEGEKASPPVAFF